MNYYLLFFSLLTTGITAYAGANDAADSTDTAKPQTVKTHAHYDGIVSLSTDGKYGFFCLGGPSVGLTQGHWRIAINLYPSLRLGRPEGSLAPQITPTLGSGFYIGYKRIVLLIPFHYISEERKWTTAVGLGWRVTK